MMATSLRKVVFLDTNVLHFVGLYLSRAKDQRLFPFGGDDAGAEEYLNGMTEADFAGHIQVTTTALTTPPVIKFLPPEEK